MSTAKLERIHQNGVHKGIRHTYSTTYVNYQIIIIKYQVQEYNNLTLTTKRNNIVAQTIVYRAKLMDMKPSKVLCCSFCLVFSGFTLQKNWQNTKAGYLNSYNYPIEAFQLCYSCTANEHTWNTKDVQGQRPSNKKLHLFVCFYDDNHSLS